MSDDKTPETLEDRLWNVIRELCSINEYEYPSRIPSLQEKADQILESKEGAE